LYKVPFVLFSLQEVKKLDEEKTACEKKQNACQDEEICHKGSVLESDGVMMSLPVLMLAQLHWHVIPCWHFREVPAKMKG
jgi:hypothetical protein